MKTLNSLLLNSFYAIKKIIPYIIAFLFMFGILWLIAFMGNIEKVVR